VVNFQAEKWSVFKWKKHFVNEINSILQIIKVPNLPSFMDGVINLRGRVILVINLGTKLGMQRKKHDKNARIIVVEVFGKIMRI